MTLRPLLAVVAAALACGAGGASAAVVTQDVSFTASDGVRLHAELGGEGAIAPRPTIVEFSPYAPGCCTEFAGPAYNYVQVHARGTGQSQGRWNATGPRDQQDVAEFLGWACRQPWSDGKLALYGFSASAIVAYNAMDLDLPCLRTAVLMAGTADLYRDLLMIGGIPNLAPGAYVMGAIGAGTLASGAQRGPDPAGNADTAIGQATLGAEYLQHPTEDGWWKDRTLDPSRLTVPILADTSFYDVESRGPFEAFKLTRQLGSQLMVMGAHDGYPAGSGGQFPRYRRWFDHYLLGEDNGIDREPHVQLWLGNGGRQEFLAGDTTRLEGDDWPLPGTTWTPLYLDGGALSPQPAAAEQAVSYPFAPSDPIASDVNTTAVVAGTGGGGYTFDDALSLVPGSTDMNQAAATSAVFTSPPLADAVDVAGPASLHLRLASTAPETDIHAVVCDVWPDGSAHPVGIGRLRTSFPHTVAARDVSDAVSGELVQPYGDFSAKDPATPGQARDYDVELWPIGNRFAAGHRIALYITGTAAYAVPPAPAVNTITTGGPARARLVLPAYGGAPRFAAASG